MPEGSRRQTFLPRPPLPPLYPRESLLHTCGNPSQPLHRPGVGKDQGRHLLRRSDRTRLHCQRRLLPAEGRGGVTAKPQWRGSVLACLSLLGDCFGAHVGWRISGSGEVSGAQRNDREVCKGCTTRTHPCLFVVARREFGRTYRGAGGSK